MATYTNNRTGIIWSTDICSFRFGIVEQTNYSLKNIFTSGYEISYQDRWLITQLEEPITTTRAVYTPETRPKTIRYAFTSSISLGQRYVFTPVSSYTATNTVNTKITKEYISRRDIYYELHIASLRRLILSIQSYTDKRIYVNVQNYDSTNTVDTIISVKKDTQRNIYVDSAYIDKRFIVSPTYKETSRKIAIVLSKYISPNIVDIGIAQRYITTINAITVSDDGLFRYAIYEVTDGNTRYSKRLAYWQPKPRHYSNRYVHYRVPLYALLNTVLIYEGTKYWQDRYIITDWFIYNTVRYIHTRYKVSDIPFTIGSTNTDILYTKDKAPKCFKFIATTYKVNDINIFNEQNLLEKFDKCEPRTFSNISKFGIVIPNTDRQNFKVKYYLEVFNNKGHIPNTNNKIKKYQIRAIVKQKYNSQRYVDIRT